MTLGQVDPICLRLSASRGPLPGRLKVAGYTSGMKVAVSIPDDVFNRAEAWARRAGKSRSEVYARALREYVGRHAPDEVTEAMDRACAVVGDQGDGFSKAAARRVLERTEW